MQAWRDIIENSGARLFVGASNLAVLAITARALGAEGRGTIVALTTWMALFAIVSGLSLGQACHRRVQERRSDEWLPELAGTMFILGVAVSFIGLGAFAWLALLTGTSALHGTPAQLIVIAGLLVPFLILDEYARNLLAAAGRLRSYATAQFVGNLLRLLLVLLAVGPVDAGVPGVILALIASQAVIVAIEGRAIWRGSERGLPWNGREARRLIGDALRVHPNTIASFLLLQANILLLDRLATRADVAHYQIAQQLVFVLLLLPQAAAMVSFGSIATLGPDSAWPAQKRLMNQVMMLMAALAAGMAIFAQVIVSLVAGPGFEPAAALLRLLLLSFPGLALAEMMAPQWFGRGFFLTSTLLTCLAAVATVGLNALLISRYGVTGAAWGTVIAYALFVATGQFGFGLWCERRHRRRSVNAAGDRAASA